MHSNESCVCMESLPCGIHEVDDPADPHQLKSFITLGIQERWSYVALHFKDHLPSKHTRER